MGRQAQGEYPDAEARLSESLCSHIFEHNREDVESQDMIIAGEWIGKGIQKRVVIIQLDLSFVIISVHINGGWVTDSKYPDIADEAVRIYNISRGGYCHEIMDLSEPEAALARLTTVTKQVDERCPFATTFFVDG
jgi:hypothetical protein